MMTELPSFLSQKLFEEGADRVVCRLTEIVIRICRSVPQSARIHLTQQFWVRQTGASPFLALGRTEE